MRGFERGSRNQRPNNIMSLWERWRAIGLISNFNTHLVSEILGPKILARRSIRRINLI